MKFSDKNVLITLLFSIFFITQNYAQILCDMGSRNVISQTSANEEYSGLAFHPTLETFFMPLDDKIDGVHIKAFGPNGKFNVSITNANTFFNSSTDDFEGLTYLENNYFVLLEEKGNDIYFLEYIPGNRTFKILSKRDTGITPGSDGLEGISYDPNTNMLYVVNEHLEIELYSMPVTLPNSNFIGSINVSQTKSVILPASIFSDGNPNTTEDLEDDAAGLFHLGNVSAASSQLSNNLLILSQHLNKVVEFDLILDANNNLSSISYLGEQPLGLENQAEGIAVANGKIYIASERGSGSKASLSSYTLQNNVLSCKLSDVNCNCLDKPGCTDAQACNFDTSATENDGSCLYANTACNDNDPTTVNDLRNSACDCIGSTIPGCTDLAACNFDVSATVDNGTCLYFNTSCDDGNSATINDIRDANCNCAGEVVLGCTDNNACNFEETATENDNSCFFPTSPCDDGNSNTSNDTYNTDCDCEGVEICATDMDDSGTISQGNYQVSDYIKSIGIVGSNQNVTYDAGSYVQLNKGFLADSDNGVVFLAKIEGCTQLRKGNLIRQQTASIKNFPNPFTGQTTIEFELNSTTEVSLFVSDISGKQIATLLNNETSSKGKNQVIFDGQNLAQGIYYCTLISDNKVNTQKMMLMK